MQQREIWKAVFSRQSKNNFPPKKGEFFQAVTLRCLRQTFATAIVNRIVDIFHKMTIWKYYLTYCSERRSEFLFRHSFHCRFHVVHFSDCPCRISPVNYISTKIESFRWWTGIDVNYISHVTYMERFPLTRNGIGILLELNLLTNMSNFYCKKCISFKLSLIWNILVIVKITKNAKSCFCQRIAQEPAVDLLDLFNPSE